MPRLGSCRMEGALVHPAGECLRWTQELRFLHRAWLSGGLNEQPLFQHIPHPPASPWVALNRPSQSAYAQEGLCPCSEMSGMATVHLKRAWLRWTMAAKEGTKARELPGAIGLLPKGPGKVEGSFFQFYTIFQTLKAS